MMLLTGGSKAIDVSNSTIVCDGNSITLGNNYAEPTPPWPAQLKARPAFAVAGCTIHNFGVSGQTTQAMISDQATQVLSLYNPAKANVLVAWEVRNSIFFSGSVLSSCNSYRTYCNTARAQGWKVVAVTITPCNQSTVAGDTAAQYTQKINEANEWIRANWAGFASTLIDAALLPGLGVVTATAYPDNVHPTNLVLVRLVDALESSIPRLRA